MSVSIDWITEPHLRELAQMRHGSNLISLRPATDDCLARLRVRTPYGIRDRKICKNGLTLSERRFLENIRDFMDKNHHQGASNIPSGKWHCFDIPFNLVCGDYDTAVKIHNSVAEKASEVKEALQISIQKD